ncbi:MAG: c-type cytochrome [Acidimicrobiaceae bacterium]|nr:c-type cytochrome [Acidimicrobiaceae bacterium]
MKFSINAARDRLSKPFFSSIALVGIVGGIGVATFSSPSAAAAQSSYSTSSSSITYTAPPTNLVSEGKSIFEENCASCHGGLAQGSSRGPNLQGLGAATIDFWVSTGRMPLADPTIQAIQKPSRFNRQQTLAIDSYVVSKAPGGPAIPDVNLPSASLSRGESLFATNCAACHTITGAGDALANNVYAPSLMPVDATQVAEAVRTGPANMPRFGPGTLTNAQVADIVKYVMYLHHPNNAGGIALGHVGPVTEGFIGILVGLGAVMLFGFWIGGRSH